MNREFDTNYILNDIYDNVDGTVRVRRFDSNYVWNAIYDPTLPGIRVSDVIGLLASSVIIDASQFDGLLNDTITDVQKLADFLDALSISSSVYSDPMQFTGIGSSASPLKLTQSTNHTLTVAGWVNGSQSVTITGLTTSHDILVSGTFANRVLLGHCGIDGVITANTVTFTAVTTPAVNIDINIKIL